MTKNPNLTSADFFGVMSEELIRSAYAPNINAYKPHPKQVMFHKMVQDKRTRLYIGGNRSGKSTAGIVEDLWWLTKRHPYRDFPARPTKGRIVSVDFLNGVKKIIIPMLKQWVPPSELKGGAWETAYYAGDRVLNFENGSFVELMSYDQDLDKFAGTARDFIHYDEEPPKDIYTECTMRLIDYKGSSWLTMTPVEGMTWVFDDLYEKGTSGHPRIGVVEIGTEENPFIDIAEVESAMEDLSPEERQARLEGRFVAVGGLVYKKFNPKIHVIPAMDPLEFKDPRRFKQYMSLDHGFNNPTAVLWHAVNSENKVITFDEHYAAEKTIKYHAGIIKAKEQSHGRRPDIRVCDPALEQRQAITGTSIRTEYAVLGIGMVTGNNDILTGIAKVTEYMNTFDSSGLPNWQITENCANLIKELKRLKWKTWATKKQAHSNNVYEQIHKKDDHACDSCRYFFTLMPKLAPINSEEVKTELPKIGKQISMIPERGMIDPGLTPEALSRDQTKWNRLDPDGFGDL